MSALVLRRKLRVSSKQRRLLEFRAPCVSCGARAVRTDENRCSVCGSAEAPQIEILGALGEYGGGKSFIAGMRFLGGCLENPFDPSVYAGGDDVPLSGIVAPTMGDLKKSTLVQFMKVCPDELIYRSRLYGEYQDIQLINGHRILLYSAEGALNGPTLCQLWVDEIQEKIYDGKWTNLQGRVREKRARRLNVQASGIAQRGHVEEIFRRPNTDTRHVELLFPEDNAKNLARGYVDEMRSTLPASRVRDKDGWLLPSDAMFPTFSRMAHLRMPPGMEQLTIDDLRDRATSISVDPGRRRGAVVFGQPAPVKVRAWSGKEVTEQGLLLVDQLMPDNVDAEELVAFIKRECRWPIVPGRSVICVDPTTQPDQIRYLKRAFPGVAIIQHQRGFYHLEENGLRAVDRALKDLNGDTRLYVAPWLSRHESGRGVVETFSEHLASRPKDKKYEHACDVVRYLTQHFIPLPMRPSTDADVVEKIERETRAVTSGLSESSL